MDFSKLATNDQITSSIAALKTNGITAELVENSAQAKAKVLELIPKGAEVMTMTSITLEETGIAEELNESGDYDSVKKKLSGMDREQDGLKMQEIGAAPEWSVGSVHAVTEDGVVVIASNTGSQLPAYAYGSKNVVWVVSTKKIVKDLEQGMQRIKEHIVPLETERARKAYGLPETFHTFPSKILIVNREVNPGRIHLIFVNESLGF